MSWIIYAIAAPAIFSITNFIDKFLVEKKIRDSSVIAIFSGFMAMLFGLVILLFRRFQLFDVRQLSLIVFAGVLAELGIVPYYRAMSTDEASRVVPLFQVIPIFVLLLSYVFLGETMTILQIVGFCFILFGGFIISAKKIEKRIFAPRASFWNMMLSSFLFAASVVIFRFVVLVQNFWDTLGWESVGFGVGALILLLWPSYRRRFIMEFQRIQSKVWGMLVLNEGVYIGGRLALSYAYALAPAAIVSVVSGIQPLFILLYGVFLSIFFPDIIREDIRRSVVGLKLFAIVFTLLGLSLIYL